MSSRDFPRIGIIGGGQLGRMMILAGAPLGFSFGVLTPHASDPAARLADHHVTGSLHDPSGIAALCEWADITTYEIEHINTDALLAAQRAGAQLHPSPQALITVNDKLEQKRVLQKADVLLPGFAERPASFPSVQKLRRGGYDGRGVKILRSAGDQPLTGESYYEELVDFSVELAVLVARSVNGEVTTWPVVEMDFDQAANICSRVTSPAGVDSRQQAAAREVAVAAVEAIDAVGVVAVELFLTRDGRVLVNELAPRPHNSGHLTIEASQTNQFEQHLRAISGLPLGDTAMRSPAIMINVLGGPDAAGAPRMPGLSSLLAMPGVHLHWYGKREVRPFRKMGHVTVIADTLERASSIAAAAGAYTRVEGTHGA